MPRNCFGEEELANLREVIESQDAWRWGRSNFVPRFEKAFGQHLGRKYVHAVNSGTSANMTAYASLGLQPGDEVICPGLAPIFVSFPIVGLGCIPIFADVDIRTQIISPESIEERITPKTRVVIVVHLNGQPAMMDDIMAVANKHGLKVVEDCAQAYDAYYKGRKVGTFGDVACFSMQQSKHITSGEGGMIATDNVEIYKRATEFSNCGMPWYMYDIERPKAEPLNGLPTRGHFSYGFDFRISELQGALALAQLGKIEQFNSRRRELVARVEYKLRDTPGVRLAYIYPDTKPNYWLYPIWGPPSIGRQGEINYIEVEYQRMQKMRQTSVGIPLPDYVQYLPGLCPQAEESTKGSRSLFVHHSINDEELDQAIAHFKKSLAGL
ncbi:DegT/DnrJ/EryC1/StrS family aminotransferase [Candidatus Poribacteria bacterium]|nr:DegT/DnrJ/EryC1/StrS family aminotransferase [Candidatus Poribacteria bacterium]